MYLRNHHELGLNSLFKTQLEIDWRTVVAFFNS